MNTELIRKDWVGRVIDGRFRLLEWMGSSGHAGVFLCEVDAKPEHQAAIKLFPADIDGAAACAAGWSIAAGLDHPNLIRVLQTGRDRVDESGVLYVVTDYAGEVLSEILLERPLNPDETRQILPPILDVLGYLHDRGLVHGRLKPSNIMVVDDQLKLSAENIRGATPIAPIPPTLDIYDAPERAAGKISPASDLWSLGVTLVESLTRIPPAWNRASTVDPMVPPSVVSPFAQIARECLRQEPNLRCSLDEVHACLASGAAVPHRAGPAEKRTATARRRILVAAASVALLALFGAFMLRWHHANSTTASALSAPSPTGEAPTATTPDSSAPPAASSTPNDSTQSGSTPPANTPAPSQPSPASQAPAQQTSAPVQPQPGAANPSPDSTPAPPPAAVTQPAPSAHSGTAKGGVAQQVMPEVPEKAIRTIEGTLKVGIQVNVDPSGAVSEATIASQGPSLYFANLALKAAQNWKFKPAIADGQPVPSVWRLRFEFHRSGTDVIPLEQNP